ncbi:MAG TPA: sigma-70 family RNA polymerase sigma factor [Gemmatimonadaceae bacterium]|nr:sigma-70 family RNA polymerase sigma factor [Gemmatimonadaceae bacterium]
MGATDGEPMDPTFRSFFDEWYPRLVLYLRARLGDQDHAEDIAQEAFVRLLDNTPRDAVGWLFAVASNLAIDHQRLANGRARHLTLIKVARDGSADPGPEQQLLREEAISRVRAALAELPDRDRELLMLRHGGWAYRDIARALGLAPSSVGSLLTRAERRFASTFQELNNDEGKRASL